jgi:hypothetical protein
MARLVPTPWIAVVTGIFGGTRRVAVQLWPLIPCSALLLWQLDQIGAIPASHRACGERMRRLSEVLSPQTLLDATLRLSPEGRKRDPDVHKLEQSILDAIDREGHWQW